jgi:Kef-type K+ transport system membrane component KefB
MMRIPGFQNAIFPTAANPNLNLVANLGLILFLFLVGLEVNMRMFLSNWRVALSVGLAGMILPFGLGSAIAWGLYHEFRNDPGTVPIKFGVYMLFIGTALSVRFCSGGLCYKTNSFHRSLHSQYFAESSRS